MKRIRFAALAAVFALALTAGCAASAPADVPSAEHTPPTSAAQDVIDSVSADSAPDELFVFKQTGEGYTLAEYRGKGGDEVVPATYRGLPVTAIGDGAFVNSDRLTSLVIPEGVTSIGDSAFYSCNNLTAVVIPSTVREIGQGAFTKCVSLKSVDIPEGVTEINLSTFYGCTGMESVTIPDTVTSIGISAFNYCDGLGTITIPDSVTDIAYRAFWECTITVKAPHDPDYYGYTPDRHVTWVAEE